MAQEQQQQSGVEQQAKPEAQAIAGATDEKPDEKEKASTSIERGSEAVPVVGRELGSREFWTNPFGFMQRMMDEMDRMFSRFGSVSPYGAANVFGPVREALWSPVIETFERDGHLVLRAELPGLERKDVHVEVVGDELVVSGHRKQSERRQSAGRYYSERRYGSFERRFTLPAGLDAECIEANFDNGVLEISLAIPEVETKNRTIEVRGGSHPEGAPPSVH